MGFWSKLGKVASIAAPIAAAPFTGGATLALIGAGAGAAGGALNGGGLKGSLLGAGMGAGSAALGGALSGMGKGAGVAAGAPGGLGDAAGAGAREMANLGIGAGMKSAAPSIFSQMARNPDVWKTGIGALNAYGEAAGKNRSSLQDAQIADYVASGQGPSPVSSKLRMRAGDLEDDLMSRLTPSFMERLGGYVSPAANIYASTLPPTKR